MTESDSVQIAKKGFGFLRNVSLFRVRGKAYNGITMEISRLYEGGKADSMALYFEDKKHLDNLIVMLVQARVGWENESDV